MERQHRLTLALTDCDITPSLVGAPHPCRGAFRRWRTPVATVASCIAALAAATLMVGCGTRPPQARVDGVYLESATADHARLMVRLEVSNSNDVPVPLEDVSYRVGAFQGLRQAGVTVPPNSVVTINLPAIVAAGDADGPFRASGRVAWVPSGAIDRSLHDAGVIRRRAGFADSVSPGADRNLDPTLDPDVNTR